VGAGCLVDYRDGHVTGRGKKEQKQQAEIPKKEPSFKKPLLTLLNLRI